MGPLDSWALIRRRGGSIEWWGKANNSGIDARVDFGAPPGLLGLYLAPLRAQRGQFASGKEGDTCEDVDPRGLSPDGVRAVVIASSLPAFASGLASWFDDPARRWRVCGVCDSTDVVFVRVSELIAPLVVATDDLDVAALARMLRTARPDAIVLVLAGALDVGYEARLVRGGVGGVLSMGSSRREVVAAASTLVAGGSVVSAAALRVLAAPEGTNDGAQCLTVRQRQVTGLLGAGLSVQRIAEELVVEVSTVKTHIDRTRRKFGFPDQRALALNASAVLAAAEARHPGVVGRGVSECRPSDDTTFNRRPMVAVAGGL